LQMPYQLIKKFFAMTKQTKQSKPPKAGKVSKTITKEQAVN